MLNEDDLLVVNIPPQEESIIKVIGVGGGGSNAVNHMCRQGIRGVEFVVCNTDIQALRISPVKNRIQIGKELTEGRGAGSLPERGKQSAIESLDYIKTILERNTKMVFITAGMGGGTGTGAAPVVARIAKEQGALTVAVVTKPFRFESRTRMANALAGIDKLKENVDTMIVIPNDKLLEVVDRRTTMPEALKKADEVLQQGIQGITDLINVPSLINLDFADIQTVMKDKGIAHIGIGEGRGDDKALEAVKQAVASPLLETTIQGASHVIINISGDITLMDASDAADYVQELAGENANIIFGAMYDDTRSDEATITVIATGLHNVGGSASKLKARLEGQQKMGSILPNADKFARTPAAEYGAGRTTTGNSTIPTLQGQGRVPSSTVKEQSIKIPDFFKK